MPKTSGSTVKGKAKKAPTTGKKVSVQSKGTGKPAAKGGKAAQGKGKGGKGGKGKQTGKKPVGKAASKPANIIKKPRMRLSQKSNPLYESRPKNFGVGQLQPKRDLTRFVKWPKYVRVQRQKRILMQRLKVPGTVNQFNNTIDKNSSSAVFKLLNKYRPEKKKEKKRRLLKEAKQIADAKKASKKKREETKKRDPLSQPKTDVNLKLKRTKKPKFVKFGLRHVTALVESKKAKLVLIAHDVDPLELVLWLPTLCKKKDVPYMIVKGKASLGQVVHKKTAAVLAVTDVHRRHKKELDILVQKARDNYNSRYSDIVRKTGGQIMGSKHMAKKSKLERIKAKEGKIL